MQTIKMPLQMECMEYQLNNDSNNNNNGNASKDNYSIN